MDPQPKRFFPAWLLALLFIVLVVMLFFGGHHYYLKQKNDIKAEQHAFLSAISNFKVQEILGWMEERKAEGRYLASCTEFIDRVGALKRDRRNKRLQILVENWLQPLKDNHEYLGIWIVDPEANILAYVSDSTERPPVPVGMTTTQKGRSAMEMFPEMEYRIVNGQWQIIHKVSLFDGKNLCGYALFVIDPQRDLFPRISIWPVKKESGESLLVSHSGDTISYLTASPGGSTGGQLAKWEVDSLSKRLPLAGTLALYETHDTKNAPVFADIRKVPGTQWSVITKINQEPIFSPLKKRAANILLLLSAFLLILVGSWVLIWKNQQLQYYRNQLKMIKESQKAEEKIRFMTALLEDVNDAIITFDKDLIIQSWNKGAERIYGWSAEEVIGKFGGGSLRVDFPGAIRETIFKELETTGNWKGEIIHRRKDGSTAFILSSTSHLRDEDGAILGIMAINKDISDVIQSEKSKNAVYRISELAHSSRSNDELYASIHVVIGELMNAENLYIALLSEDGKSLSFPYFIDEKETPPATGPLHNGLTEFVLKTGKPLLARPEDIDYLVARELIDIVGEPAVDWLGVPLKIEKETIGVVVVQSYSKEIRYGDREKNILLFVSEQIALTIHRRKMQQELIEAKQRAEVSSKLTSALLANMNHELRTPMNGILGFAEILMEELTDPDARTKASNILVSGRRLMETLDAIMDLSYLQSDKINRNFVPVDLRNALNSIQHRYAPVCEEKYIEFDLQLNTSAMAIGNEQLIRHMLRNLVDNAVKYTSSGSVTLTLDQVIRGDKAHVAVAVKDTGIGISPENQKMIFEAFRQVSEGYGRKFEGSGLGLTIIKKIIDLLGGEINVVSELGAGSTFTIFLPCIEEQAPDKSLKSRVSHRTEHQTSIKRPLPDVLLVEDNLVNLQLLMVYVRDYCNVFSALNAKAAIEMTQQRKFDAILMDINLGPGTDGIQAMLEIRKRPDYKTTPIVAVTGYASIGDSERLLAMGFSVYLAKPYEKETIAALMKDLFPA